MTFDQSLRFHFEKTRPFYYFCISVQEGRRDFFDQVNVCNGQICTGAMKQHKPKDAHFSSKLENTDFSSVAT